MTRIMFTVLLLTWMAGAPAADSAAQKPFNILFVLTDDQAPGFTGYEGHPLVRTPNLDALAARSARFTRCYTPTPQCAPSRATILTGLYPHAHEVVTNPSEKRPLTMKPSADTFSARLQREGYFCGIVGKWHLPYESSPEPGHGFTDYVATQARDWQWNDCPVWVNGEQQTADAFLTDWNGDRAIDFLEQAGDKPFLLWLNFRAPHAPLVYPPGMEEMYSPEEVDLPEELMEVPVDPGHRPASLNRSPAHAEFAKLKPPYDALREARSKYYAMISRVDENVGRVLRKLDELDMRDRTIVIFASDNGWALGEHRLYTKGPFFYDELARVPLLIAHPTLTREGMTIERIVGLVDLAPTILTMAGITPPMGLHGDSLLPLIQQPDTRHWVDEAFFAYDMQQDVAYPARGLVTPDFKFIDYLNEPDPNDVFYDLTRDPQETFNVNHPTRRAYYGGIMKPLRARLKDWQRQTRDPLYKK